MRIKWYQSGLVLLAISIGLPAMAGEGVVQGFGRYPKLINQPSRGYQQLYEWNLFMCPFGGTSVGPSRRLGAPPGEPARHDGYYQISAAPGRYALYVNQPLFYARPRVVPEVMLESGKTVTRHVGPAVDFCCNTTDTWALPWQDTWYQTFEARGSGITGISFRLAGTSADAMEVSVLSADAGKPVTQWSLASAGATRRVSVGALGDNWVRWRSGTVPTEPGKTYAVRLNGVSGGDRKFSPFNRNKDSYSYASGEARNAAGAAQNYDLNVTVFSDSDGTVVSYCKTTTGLGELRDGFYGGRWGQTFQAKGNALAAVDVWAAGADNHWDLDFTFTVRKGGPTGQRVGPSKTTRAAYQAFGVGLHAVCYNPGEVTLEPGATYYVEFTNPEGFNPFVMNDSQDAYAGGRAYKDGVAADGGSADLSMTIMEYASEGGRIEGEVKSTTGAPIPSAQLWLAPGPHATTSDGAGLFALTGIAPGTYALHCEAAGFSSAVVSDLAVAAGETREVSIQLVAEACDDPFVNGGFENGKTGWTFYGGAKSQVIQGSWFADIEAVSGGWFQGNEVNGNPLPPGGLYQRFCAVPGHRYRAEVYSNLYWIGGDSRSARNRLGLDPSGGTSATAGSVTWSAWHVQPREATEGWRKLAVEAEATSPFMTLFLDFLQTDIAGSEWHINCFDAAAVTDLTPPGTLFRRGDCNNDGDFNLSDAVCILSYLFSDGGADCMDALDTQDDGALNLADAVYLLAYLFANDDPPAPPGLACGLDETEDDLDCAASGCPGR